VYYYSYSRNLPERLKSIAIGPYEKAARNIIKSRIQTTVKINVNGESFSAKGKIVKSKGWR